MANNPPAQQPPSREPREHPAVPGDTEPVFRSINEPLDEHEARFVGGISVAGIIVGGAVGALLGLLLAIIPGVTWWMGVIIGFFVAATAVAFTSVRLGLRRLEPETWPHDVTTTAARKAQDANRRT